MTAQTSPHQPPISNLTVEQISELAAIQNFLALAWHRNKNQHRRSRWWAELGMLKRSVQRLTAATGVRHGGGKNEIGLRVRFLREELLERCWLAFSAVVADNQYAALGLMLLGTLARLGKVLGVEIESQFQAADRSEDVAKATSETLGAESRKRVEEGVGGDVDIGVVLRREELKRDADSTGEIVIDTWEGRRLSVVESNEESLMPDSRTSVSKLTSTIKPHKKRKRKKGDEFDELFSSLI